MIGDLSVLGLITARGGSKGVHRKNLREVGGKSLIARTVEAARASACLDRVVLSSDDPEIIQAAIMLGCEVPFVRPAELATDEARSTDVVRHALTTLQERYNMIVLLQPTSPFCTGADIDGTLRLCVESSAPACVSVCDPAKPPHWTFELGANGRMTPLMPAHYFIPRRQELPRVFAVNGAVFAAHCDWIVRQSDFMSPETLGYVMPQERSLDIDNEFDLVLAEAVASWLARDPQDQNAVAVRPRARKAASRGRSSG